MKRSDGFTPHMGACGGCNEILDGKFTKGWKLITNINPVMYSVKFGVKLLMRPKLYEENCNLLWNKNIWF